MTFLLSNEVLDPKQIHAGTASASTLLDQMFITNELHAELTGDPHARLIVVAEDATLH